MANWGDNDLTLRASLRKEWYAWLFLLGVMVGVAVMLYNVASS